MPGRPLPKTVFTPFDPNTPLDPAALSALPLGQRKALLHDCLFPMIFEREPAFATEIAAQFLRMSNEELVIMFNESDKRIAKINELAQLHRARQAGCV